MKTRKINVITLGCAKNIVDSEYLLKQLETAGFNIEHDAENSGADTVIINTCGFINDAKEESIDTILRYAVAKRNGEINRLIVTGCLSEKYMNDLKKEIPEVDIFFGVNSLKPLLKQMGIKENPGLPDDRFITGPGHYAYLKISEGCNRTCSFCTIPQIRGPHISRPAEEILAEADLLAEKGVKELILVAQDLNYYGVDLQKKRMLTPLVEKLISKNRFSWIRLHYLYPAGLPESLLELIRNNKLICKYIDIPLQHITDRMLRLMRRSYTRYSAEKILWHIRETIPDVAIRTTLIAGHPGETEKDFDELKRFVEKFRFERLGIFRYSHEDGTYSWENYADEIPEEVKEERASEIMRIEEKISLSLNQRAVNKIFDVIIDRSEDDFYYGRTQYDSPEIDQEVLIPGVNNLVIGNIYKIRITGVAGHDLYGVPQKK